MKTKNGHILTFSEKMQISAILCFATCDWFCPMTSQITSLPIVDAMLRFSQSENVRLSNLASVFIQVSLTIYFKFENLQVGTMFFFNLHMPRKPRLIL